MRLFACVAGSLCLLFNPASASPAPDFPHAPIELPSGNGEAEFHLLGDRAILTIRTPDGKVAPLRIIDDVDDALAVLADRRLAFAWPALLDWSGGDLEALRDRALARSRASIEVGLPGAIPKTQAERWNGDATLTASLQLARALQNAGQRTESIALLRRWLEETPAGTAGNAAREFLTIRLAGMMFEAGDTAAAIAMLEAESANPVRRVGEKNNLNINLAAMLVRSGSYQRGLILLNQVWRDYAGTEPVDDSFRVPESELQFAWIRACALDGLGRRDQAKALLGAMTEAVPADIPGQLTSVANARIQLFYCMRDAAGLAAEMARSLASASPASDIFVLIQPSTPTNAPDRATLQNALRQLVLVSAMKDRSRSLEPAFTAAVSHWRVP